MKIRNYVSSEKNKKITKFIILMTKSNSTFVLFCFYFYFSFLKKKIYQKEKKGTIGIGLYLEQAYSTTEKE